MIDDLDVHIAAAGDLARAAVPTGFYLAWCANLNLFSAAFAQRWAQPLLRVKYREITGAELFVGACAGSFQCDQLNAQGQQFTRAYYPRYFDDLAELFGDDVYGVANNWDNYDLVARLLTAQLLGPARTTAGQSGARRWWQFWR